MNDKILIIILTVICTFNFSAQSLDKEIASEKFSGKNVRLFIDSLKHKILSDTVKFNNKDLIHINGWTENQNPYSMLITVNMKYNYRLDIVENNLVKQFAEEILNFENIESVNFINKEDAPILFGSMAKDGWILITLKPNVKLNFGVGGLKFRKGKKQKGGNNFLQRKAGELMIRT